MNPEIEFEVGTAAGTSEKAVSRTGSGAGRGTGGPGFEVPLEFHFANQEGLRKYTDEMADYADDSEIKIPLESTAISEVIEAFRAGEKLGLFMHAKGKKGPTLLVHEAAKISSERLIESNKEAFNCDVNVVTSVKFLGREIYLCPVNNLVLAKTPDKLFQLLSFFISEINRSVRLTQNFTGKGYLNNFLHAVSQTTASLIESRIQYSICFLDRPSLATLYNLHRKAVCALAGKPFRFFGFKNFYDKQSGNILNLWEYFDSLQSKTYIKLCLVLGRPTLKQMCLRAANVIFDQSNLEQIRSTFNKGKRSTRKMPPFMNKITEFLAACHDHGFKNTKPKSNDFYKAYTSFDSFQKRRNFVKAVTDNLLLDHLDRKGFDHKNLKCRAKGCVKNVPEDFVHIIEDHVDRRMTPGAVERAFDQILKQEVSRKRKNPDSRPKYDLDPQTARFLAE